MRAAMMFGPDDVRVEDVADPQVQQPGDAVVRVSHASVCGTDLHPFRDGPALPNGTPMGHELIGTVAATGSEVTSFREGDRVLATFSFQDNSCERCRRGVQSACERGGFVSGAQAELVRVPLADGTLVRLPDDVEESMLPSLLTLSDVYGTGFHAARTAGVTRGDTVVVVGDGSVGILAVLSARRLGAERIVVMGRHRTRTELARAFGATDVVVERGEEGVARVLDLTDGGAARVVEAVGHRSAYDQSVAVVRPGGVISRVGVPQYDEAPVGFTSLFGRNITLTGGVAPVRAYVEELLPIVLGGGVEPGRVFDLTVGLDDVLDGYRAMSERTAIKTLIRL